jgi:3D (Asp-Asp-Asp) domain-containing protein
MKKKTRDIILLIILTIAVFGSGLLLSGSVVYHNMNQTLADVEWELIDSRKNLNKIIEDYKQLEQEFIAAGETIEILKSDEYELVYMGDFKITYYCNELYLHTCGGTGTTASGKKTEVGVTAAADWSVLPKGSMVYIENVGFREIQDKGGAVRGNHIDVLVNLHSEAKKIGVNNEGVWLLVKTRQN